MDPNLEKTSIWPDVQNGLIVAIRDDLAAKVRPRYYVRIEQRVYLSEPDEKSSFRMPYVSVLGASGNGDASDHSPLIVAEDAGDSAVAVRFPLPEEVREGYLEVREVGSDYLTTAIEVLSSSNKHPGIYDSAGYDLALNYAADAEPALSDAEADWADELLRDKAL
ncbi:MAG: DUF4058 family protein [Chloroflexi bacterium]|nr:DUF4058 family protein [Chloroflexota bacterium]